MKCPSKWGGGEHGIGTGVRVSKINSDTCSSIAKVSNQLSYQWKFTLNYFNNLKLVWWLWEETHVPKVMVLNPSTVYWMDMFQIDLL